MEGVIAVGYRIGLRRNEILNLTWADIDFENQRIHVQAKNQTEHTIEWEPRNHKNRLVPLSEEATQFSASRIMNEIPAGKKIDLCK